MVSVTEEVHLFLWKLQVFIEHLLSASINLGAGDTGELAVWDLCLQSAHSRGLESDLKIF